jgi:dihydroorotase-like cyclic amidohydrolase
MWYECAPPFVEAEALQRAAYLSKMTGTAFFAVHVSSAESLKAVAEQRKSNSQIYIETCPHYLTHDVDSEIGDLGKVNPPLRMPGDREALWEALREGTIDVVGSDHVPRIKAAKGGGIWKGSAGFPGTETLLPILISEGHVKRRIPLERIMAAVSANPARIMGLSPRKGTLSVGSDADFVMVDLNDRYRMELKDIHSGAGYSIYEGWEVLCRVVHTIVRGEFVKRDGVVQAMEGHGTYFPRHRCGAG